MNNSGDGHIFVYGTLRDEGVRNAVLGHAVTSVMAATLPEYSARLVKGESYPMIKPMAGEVAEGMILDGLSADDIAALDRFEGEHYRRVKVDVLLKDASVFHTEMYIETLGRDEDGPFDLEGWLLTRREDFITSFMQGRGFDRPAD